MTVEKINTNDNFGGVLEARNAQKESVDICGKYLAECYDSAGNLKWKEEFDNLVTTTGKNYLLNIMLGTTAKAPTWFMGLIVANGYSNILASDTMASHAGWIESGQQGTGIGPRYNTAGSTVLRPTITFATGASSGAITSSNSVAFNITSNGTCKGAFIVDNSTKAGTTGVLYSAGLFPTGDRILVNGDILRISYTATA
jgi:hypothetical protein